MSLVNRLLPFATPGTPIWQDMVHFSALAILLYYAPQIQERAQNWRHARSEQQVLQQREGDIHPDAHEPVPEPQRAPIVPEGNHEPDHRENNGADAEAGQPQPPRAPDEDPGEAGPAHAARLAAQRNIGAKKAKSLAKKDQRRAYHEFQRSQGDAQRARDAHGAAEREAAQAAELARRKAAEAQLEEKKAKDRERRREQERLEREREMATRERAVRVVKELLEAKRMANLFEVGKIIGGDHDDVALEKILNAAGVLGTSSTDGSVNMVTSTGWVVRVGKDDMREAYAAAGATQEKEIDYEAFGEILLRVLRARSA